MSLMAKKSINSGCKEQGKDNILSSLPDFLLYEILSFLPIKTAATTSILSHRWLYLWTHITRISVPYALAINTYYPKYLSIMDHIISQLSLLKLNSFCISVDSLRESWFPLLCSRNSEQITIESKYFVSKPCTFIVPACIFQTQSLVVLKFRCRRETSYKFPDNGIVKLPNLKKLQMMDLSDSNTNLLATLFKSCPVLEVLDLWLVFKENDHVVDISSPQLKSVKVDLWGNKYNCTEILIDAPKLEYLRFSGSLACYRFAESPKTLEKVKLNLQLSCFDAAKDALSSLFRGIYWVKSLILFKNTLFALNTYSYNGDVVLSFFRKLVRVDVFHKLQKIMNVPCKKVRKQLRRIEINDTED